MSKSLIKRPGTYPSKREQDCLQCGRPAKRKYRYYDGWYCPHCKIHFGTTKPNDKHYRHSGFSAKITRSYTSPSTSSQGITWDSTNAISADIKRRLQLISN